MFIGSFFRELAVLKLNNKKMKKFMGCLESGQFPVHYFGGCLTNLGDRLEDSGAVWWFLWTSLTLLLRK